MSQTFGPANSQTNYLPVELDLPENDEKLSRQLINKREALTAQILNTKENGDYEKVELLSGKRYFTALSGSSLAPSYIYRLAFDLVQLNGGSIPTGTTTLSLSATTMPPLINIPTAIQFVTGYGAAQNGTNWYFVNDPNVYVRTNIWTSTTQQIIIQNNTGASLTQFVWAAEYIKT
jgi:hypothetical protein